MKILYVIPSLNLGGAETLVYSIAKELKENIDISIYVLKSSHSYLEVELKNLGIKIIESKSGKNVSFGNIKELLKLSKEYDIVHTHLSYAQYYGALITLFNRKSIFITTEHSTNNKRRKGILFKGLDYFVYGRYKKIIAISRGAKKALEIWQPKMKNKIVLLENGIDLRKFKEYKLSKEELKKEGYLEIFNKENKNLLMVGSFRKEKDQKTLIEALSMLGNEYRVILAGDGELREYLKDLSRKLGVEDRVEFLGKREDVPNLMNLANVFILSSNWEGFGLVAIESMACGTPVIASEVEGLSEVVGNSALLFEKNKADDLKNKIDMIFNEEGLYEKLKSSGKERCKRYDIKNKAKEHLKLYSELLQS